VRGPRGGEFWPLVDAFGAELEEDMVSTYSATTSEELTHPALLPGHAVLTVLRRLSSVDATDSFRFEALSL
jgi:hypothetical protein